MAFILRKPPQTDDPREVSVWLDELFRKLTESNALGWDNLDKATSNLNEIATRNHDVLQGVNQVDETDTNATKDKHVSNLLAKDWEDHKDSHNPPGVAAANGVASAVSVTGADADLTYGANERDLINELKADVNTLVTDVNAAITQLNALLASLRTITIINT